MKEFKKNSFQKIFGYHEQLNDARQEFNKSEKRTSNSYQLGIAASGSISI